MAQNTQRKVLPRPRADAGSVSALAGRALRVLAERRHDRAADLSETVLADLEASVRGLDPGARDVCLRRMLAQGVSPDEIMDLYIPEVAQRLGRGWCDDTLSFAEVTIGAARLQGMLRDIGDIVADRALPGPQDAASVVVMVLADEYHTLGAMVLTGQLRRLGVSVRLVIGRPVTETAAMLRDGGFDAVLISVPLKEDLEDVREMISTLRGAAAARCPLIVGGGILQGGIDVRVATGADHATNDLHEAIRICAAHLSGGVAR